MIDRNSNSQQLVTQHPRLAGFVCFCMGLGAIYCMLVLPIQQAKTGASEIVISLKLVVVGVMLAFMGLAFIIFRARCFPVMRPEPGESKTPFHIAFSVFLILGLGVYFYIRQYLESAGYSFQ